MIDPDEMGPHREIPYKVWSKQVSSNEKDCSVCEHWCMDDDGHRTPRGGNSSLRSLLGLMIL